jgi:hypothetical protein
VEVLLHLEANKPRQAVVEKRYSQKQSPSMQKPVKHTKKEHSQGIFRHLRPKPRQINIRNLGGSVQLFFNRNFGLSNKLVNFLPELRLKRFSL